MEVCDTFAEEFGLKEEKMSDRTRSKIPEVKDMDGVLVLTVASKDFRDHASKCFTFLSAGKVDEIRITVHRKELYKITLVSGTPSGRLKPGPLDFTV